jgi:transposase-like protein
LITIDRFKKDKLLVKKEIFVDETLLQIDGKDYWLWWIAYEPNQNQSLMMYLSRKRAIFFVYYQQFFKQIRDKFGGRKPIFIENSSGNLPHQYHSTS